MHKIVSKVLSHFFIAGINYRISDTATRGLYAFTQSDYESFAKRRSANLIPECYILSTCNRTEIYGFATDSSTLIRSLCSLTKGDTETFEEQAYIMNGEEAVRHLFEVSCGLDSQILGDFEISSQVKLAAKNAKEADLLGSFTERALNSALKVSKRVRTETKLKSGTMSVAYAVIQYLKKTSDVQNKNILLYGLGKIGKSTCRNIQSYLGAEKFIVINRTESVAKRIAEELGISFAPLSLLKEKLQWADIILVATNASSPTIHGEDIESGKKLIIDLSVPKNVSDDVRTMENIRVVDVDELSKVRINTLRKRKQEIPLAKMMVNEELEEFISWYHNRSYAAMLKEMKEKITALHREEIEHFDKQIILDPKNISMLSSQMAQKVINVLAGVINNEEDATTDRTQILNNLFDLPIQK